MHSHSDFRR
jgi:hypothetical protein